LKKIQHIVIIVNDENEEVAMEALLIFDMLNDFVLPGSPLEVPDTRKIIPVIRAEIDKAHAEGRPVIYGCDAHDPDDNEFRKFGWPAHGVRGSKGAEVVEELKPSANDIIIMKKTYTGFYGTALDATLKRLNVDSVRLTGTVTHICILFTALDAVRLDYTVTVVENGVAGISREDHEAALRIMKNVLGVKIVKTEPAETFKKAA
jgi:nicotinamidase/pyrazinamidase